MVIRINTIRINQNGNIFYIGKITAENLLNIATTKVRRHSTSGASANYLNEVNHLLEISNSSIWDRSEKDLNHQREASVRRLKEIGNYLEGVNAIFPNSIICNLSTKGADYDEFKDDKVYELVHITDDYIEFDSDEVELNIVDGQHRLGGFGQISEDKRDMICKNFELAVTILVGLLHYGDVAFAMRSAHWLKDRIIFYISRTNFYIWVDFII